MESDSHTRASGASLSRAEAFRLAWMLASIAVLIGLGALLLARILNANHAVKQAPRITTPTMVGASAPNVTLTIWSGGAAGQSLALASLRGQPVVLNIWESSCIPCQSEAPLLEAAYDTYGQKGVAFVGVALETPQSDGLAFIQQHHLTYLAGLAPTEQTVVDYRIIGVPDTYFINRQGVIVYAIVGQLDQQRLAQGLAKLGG